MNVLLIDDEKDALSVLKSMLNIYCPDVNVVGEASDVETGAICINKTKPDLIFLDINLGKLTGFDLLDQFPSPFFRTIFVTAHDQHALRAFHYAALDYILKPIDPDQLIAALDKARKSLVRDVIFEKQIANLKSLYQSGSCDKIVLPSTEGIAFVELTSIIYAQADSNYCLFYTIEGEKMIVSKTLKDYEGILPKALFFRTHQSFIVNTRHVKKILKEDGGYALMKGGKKIPISRRKKEAFIKSLME